MRTATFDVHDELRAYRYDGIYVPREVSGYLLATMPARQRPPTSKRIFYWIRRGLVAPDRKNLPGRDLVISFEDLVSCQAITLLREAGYTLKWILEAEHYFAQAYGVRKPFAHHTFWYSGPDLFGEIDGRLIAGNRGGQLAFEFIREWLRRLEVNLGFADTTRLANCWQATEGITLRPNVQFGQPCLVGTRIPASAIWSYIRAGDSREYIAKAYGIGVADVDRAVAWQDRVNAALESSTAIPA